jgi:hypothetical protein
VIFGFRPWLSKLAAVRGLPSVGITFGDPVEGDLSTQTFSLLRRLWRFLSFVLAQQAGFGLRKTKTSTALR